MQTRLNHAIVKQLREDRLWSQEQLADIAGISARTIQRLENGATVSFETAKALSAAFGVPVSELTESVQDGLAAGCERAAAQEGDDASLAFWIHLVTFIGVIALLSAINFGSERTDFWVLWPAIGWGIGVFAHGAAILLNNRFGQQTTE